MNGLMGRARRVLAGLVSAMMVLTSLPLTGVAAYAESAGSVASTGADAEESSEYEAPAGEEAVADVDETAGEAAEAAESTGADAAGAEDASDGVAEEVDDAAVPDRGGEVTVYFRKPSLSYVNDIYINGEHRQFSQNTASANVAAGEKCDFVIACRAFEKVGIYTYAKIGETDLVRDGNTFSFIPTGETTIDVDARPLEFDTVTPGIITDWQVGIEKKNGKYYYDGDSSFVRFEPKGVSDDVIALKDVKAMAGETELVVDIQAGRYILEKMNCIRRYILQSLMSRSRQ